VNIKIRRYNGDVVNSAKRIISKAGRETPVYAALALLILGPLLLPGYILTLDMYFTPELRLPAHVDATYPFWWLLHVLDLALPSMLVQKVMLFAILLLSGLGAHKLAARLVGGAPQMALYFAGLLYMVNPFTYDRFISGQYLVLFGYALLPWFTRSLLGFAAQPGWKAAVRLAAWAVGLTVVSIHTVGMALVIAGLVVALQLWRSRYERFRRRQLRLAGFAAVVAGLWAVAGSFWIIPALTGAGRQAQTVASFTEGDRTAFATSGSNAVEKVANVLSLQGFWAERTGLHVLPQDVTPAWLWVLLMLGLMALAALGAAVWWRQRRRGEAAIFICCVLIGALLGAGIGSDWLAAHVPFFAGYREPQKFAALVALGYTVLACVGFAALLRKADRSKNAWGGAGAGILLALPFALTPTLPWAAMNQLQAAHYPVGWYQADDYLNKNNKQPGGRVLFLPWHMYLYLDMSGRVSANPARQFFDQPVITSHDPEFEGAALDTSRPEARRIDAAIKAASKGQPGLPETLAELDVKFVLLARENDYEKYGWLSEQPGLVKVADYGSIVIYRNEQTHGSFLQYER
jgi:hypothetical protein